MDRLAINAFTILLIGSAAVLRLSEAACERQTCSIDSDCTKAGHICLGPDGNETCWYCGCRQRHECELDGKHVICNCSDSDGYSGTFCECQPAPSDLNDPLSIYGECNGVLLATFDVFAETLLVSGNSLTDVFTSETTLSDCQAKCEEFFCYGYSFGSSICYVFSLNYTISSSTVLNNYVGSPGITTYIRRCVVR